MLKIGEFSRISQVSVKMLRHYDALGVLRPSQTDPESGYRFYEMGQLVDVVRVLALKDCGFALEEIARLLQTNDAAAIEVLLRQRVAEQKLFVAEEQARLQRMIARAKQLASTDVVSLYDVALKRTEPLTLVGVRQCVASTEEIGPFARFVVRRFVQQELFPLGPLVHLYFDVREQEACDLFVGAPVAALPSSMAGLSCQRLAGGEQVACAIYQGDYPGIGAAYAALGRWISASGYHIAGPCREIYHRSPLHTSIVDCYLTEIQYPVLTTRLTNQSDHTQE